MFKVNAEDTAVIVDGDKDELPYIRGTFRTLSNI